MKKTIILLCIIVILCGCKDNKIANDNGKKDIIVFPNAQTESTLNGYKTESETVFTEPEGILYIANTSSQKFHIADCKFAKSIKEENKLLSNSREELTLDGYSPCKTCKP